MPDFALPVELLGWMLIHSLWQVAMIVVGAGILLWLLRKRSAHLRYLVGCAAMALSLAMLPMTFWWLRPAGSDAPQAVNSTNEAAADEYRPESRQRESLALIPEPGSAIVLPPASIESDESPPNATVETFQTALPRDLLHPIDSESHFLRNVKVWIQPYLAWLVSAWAVGVLLLSARPVLGWWYVNQLCRSGLSNVDEALTSTVARLSRSFGIRQTVAIFQSALVEVPCVIGAWKPIILLPATVLTGLTVDQLEAVLAHELAHIRRFDFVVNILQTLVETLLFYHPAIWWLSGRIRQERENCCDDLAIRLSGDAASYAQMLVSVERLRGRIAPATVAAGGGSLVARIRRLTAPPPTESRSGVWNAIILGAMVIMLAAWAWSTSPPSHAQTDDSLSPGDTSQQQSPATRAVPGPGSQVPVRPRPGEWPQWGGSSLRNHVASGRLPIDWDISKGTNVLWKADLGTQTYSSPVIADGKVLMGTNNGQGLDARHPATVDMSCLVCFDQQTGRLLWQYASEKLPAGRVHDWPMIGLCSTPCIVGDRVWFVSNRCEVICLDLNGFRDQENDGPIKGESATTEVDADLVWQFDLFLTLGVRPLHQSVSSVTVVDGVVLLNTSNSVDESHVTVPAPHAPAFLALDAQTGRVVWQHTSTAEAIRVGGSSCSNVGASPAVASIDGVTQAIFTGREGWVYGFDFADLKRGQSTLLWSFDCNPKLSIFKAGPSRRNSIISTPVVWDDKVFVATGRNPEVGEGPADLWCIDPARRGDISPELVFNKSHENGTKPIPHKYLQACDPDAGDFVQPNPNSGAVWHYDSQDRNGDDKIAFEETFHRAIGTPAIHDGLLFIADFGGLLHCLEARTGKVHWTHDLLSAVWGSCLIVDGRVVVCDEEGDLAVFQASRTLEIVKEENFHHPVYGTPVAVDNTLFVASQRVLTAVRDPHLVAIAPQTRAPESTPAAPTILLLLDSQDQLVSGTVQVGRVGYASGLHKLPAWTTNRQRQVELTGLAVGKHLLVAKAPGNATTIFPVEWPAAVSPIRQRLDRLIPWPSNGTMDPLEIRTQLNLRSGRAVIDVEFTNKTDQPIVLPLLSMVDADCRVFLPGKLVSDNLTIKPHSTRSIPLHWTRIVKEGIWTSRQLEEISEPWPAKPAGEGLRYFRLDVGHYGTLPLALPKPEDMLQQPDIANAAQSPPRRNAMEREFPLGNFGGIPQRGSRPAPVPIEARPAFESQAPWLDAEYFLQYRIRFADDGAGDRGKSAQPLVFLDIRNTGNLDLALEKVQSRHTLIVDQAEFERTDQPWGGIDPIEQDGLCLPFLLTSDWKAREGKAGLQLTPGPHSVAIRLNIHQTGRTPDGELRIEPRGGRGLTTRPFTIEIPEPEALPSKDLIIENMRRELVAFPRFFAPTVSAHLRHLIQTGQPESGDFLLKSLGAGNMLAPDPAAFVIANTWDTLSRSQREQYLKLSMTHFVEQRPTYPQGVDAGIAVGPRFVPDFAGLPRAEPEITSRTVTTHFLDGQQVGAPMSYANHTTISHWFRTGSLPLGKHSIRLVTDYEFQQGSEKYIGTIETERTFEIVRELSDSLQGPHDPVIEKHVRKSIQIVEATKTTTWGTRGWQPQMRWAGNETIKPGSLHTPSWSVTQPLPVDLCFQAELRLEQSDDSIACSEIVVLAGKTSSFYFHPLNSISSSALLRKYADEQGFVKVRVILTPSRSVAISDPRIRQYFGSRITSDVVRVRVDHDEIGDEFTDDPAREPGTGYK